MLGDPNIVNQIRQHGFKIDPKVYEQILYNVFLNACKFNKVQGSIKISVQASQSAHGNFVVLVTRIEDTGIGMNKA